MIKILIGIIVIFLVLIFYFIISNFFRSFMVTSVDEEGLGSARPKVYYDK